MKLGGETATVTSDRYLHILSNIYLPKLERRERREIYALGVYFQQDGAAPQMANRVLEWLQESFAGKLIALKTKKEWPQHSLGLIPLKLLYEDI